MKGCVVQNQPVPDELVGRFRDSSTELSHGDELRRRLAGDGYVFLRQVGDKDEVLAAREEVFGRLMDVAEIKPPAIDGIATGQSRRRELVDDLGAFWKSVSEGPALRRISHGPRVAEIIGTIFGEPARPHDYMWLRPGPAGRSTRLHFDHPFFAVGAKQVCTVWIALGDIPVSDGPLMIVEGSNTFTDLVDAMRADNDGANSSPDVAQRAAYQSETTDDTIAFIRGRQTRLLTEDFFAGDLVVFSMFTMHGSLDNHSSIERTRLSCDVRYQLASDPVDARYFGPNPEGAKGGGYGEMKAAKPLTEPW